MRVQTFRSVPFSDVLARLEAHPDNTKMDPRVDIPTLVEHFSSWNDLAFGTDIHFLVRWDDMMEDLAACFAELGWLPFDANHVFPADTFTYNPPTFVDLEG